RSSAASDVYKRQHYCQRSKPVPDVCPECRSRYIRYFGSGTQKVEEELKRIWPDVRILRMDQDTTGRKMAHEHILADFAAGKYDILLGTQMVAKGHDIPNVTAVGIISADTALNLPDFRAAEKTFSLLTQAAGRAGRGERPGHVVVQTYNPEHYAVVAGVAQDYAMFYQAEMGFRRSLGYPPFSKIIKITFVGAEEAVVFRQANNIAAQLNTRLRQSDSSAEVLGPFAAAVSRLDDVFRINIMLKVNNLPAAQAVLTEMNLSAQPGIIIDVEPLNTM
ncbi:MAG: primosomal protein N', partial [Negativicutes bacterium]|nr:primosomal protein N' [Negativicutes bacterium]